MRCVERAIVRAAVLLASLASGFAPLATMAGAARAARLDAPVIATTITADEWARYRSRYVTAEGRVVDVEKDGVSHSEGQGYGLLLAVKAGDRATFDAILGFTWANLRLRSDALLSWIYEPGRNPRVTDTNNATDGDILIAYALVLAAVRWDGARYLAIATPLVEAIGRNLLVRRGGYVVLRPAAYGFDAGEQPDGPVVNLSYFVYGALLLFQDVAPGHPWLETWQSGLMLTEAAGGRHGVVPDWVSLSPGRFLTAPEGFRAASSYDAVRIPLYMALGGRVPPRYFAAIDSAWRATGGPADRTLGGVTRPMGDPGYRMIGALTACGARGEAIPEALLHFRPTTYFASTLHLLSLAAARENYPACLLRGDEGLAPLTNYRPPPARPVAPGEDARG